MKISFLVRRSLRQHRVSTLVTSLCAALATGLVMAVFSLEEQSRDAFTGGETGFDAVLGARGSALQLVLNSVFHLETSPGNIPWELYRAVEKDPGVSLAIPYAVGDSYRGYRVVGTDPKLFSEGGEGRFRVAPGGRLFNPAFREAVLGATASERLSLRVGDTFQPSHGVTEGGHVHEEVYTVVGVLEPVSSPADRVLWIPIDGIFRMSGHVLRGKGETYTAQAGESIPDEHKEVSAVMLRLRNPMAGFQMSQRVNNEGKTATLAWPIGKVMAEIFDKLGWIAEVLRMVAYLVVAVAAASILASLYNTMNERRREFAILRALGARRATVFSAIVAEATAIAAIGALLGLLVHGAILFGAAAVVRAQTGVVLDPFRFHPAIALAPLGMVLLGALSGILPAFKAYSTDVAENLVPQS
jgi:putative ABC transport system permease protein